MALNINITRDVKGVFFFFTETCVIKMFKRWEGVGGGGAE